MLSMPDEELFARLLRDRTDNLRWLFAQATSQQLAAAQPLEQCLGHFRQQGNFDPKPLLEEVDGNIALFSHSQRQTIREQEHTETVFLRRPDYSATPLKTNYNVQETCRTKYYEAFPCIAAFAERFAREAGRGSLGMVSVVRLKPGMMVHPHFDRGLYYAVRDRYHLVLRSQGSEMHCGGQSSVWQEGEIWWFNNKLRHSARNLGDAWRVHVIFDVLPDKNVGLSQRMKVWAETNLIE